jgi:hypothetical protein
MKQRWWTLRAKVTANKVYPEAVRFPCSIGFSATASTTYVGSSGTAAKAMDSGNIGNIRIISRLFEFPATIEE